MEAHQQRSGRNNRRLLVAGATIGLVVIFTALLYVYRDRVAEVGSWGYLGAFIIGLIGNATILLPMPGLLLLFALGITFNPVLVGLAGAAGGAIGEMSGYLAGYSGKEFIGDRKAFTMAERWTNKYGMWAIFVFALVPILPIDIAGIGAGMLRFPVWKFMLAALAGKFILYTGLTLAAAWGWQTVEGWLT